MQKYAIRGSIDRTVTAKMVRLLNINVKEYISFEEFNKEDEIILVDAQKGNSNIIDMNGQEIICIDHHPYMSILIIGFLRHKTRCWCMCFDYSILLF